MTSSNERRKIVAYWMEEREKIRLAKEAGEPAPWTFDPILAAFRFCNVRREDDRVTRWIKQNWRDPYAGHRNMLTAMVLARMVNWPATLEDIGFPEDWGPAYIERASRLMRARAERGEKLWTSAYMISTAGARRNKVDHVLAVVGRAHENNWRVVQQTALEEAWLSLKEVNGLGPFLAAQVVADYKHVPGSTLENAKDWWTWAAPGPGSERGLRWLAGRERPVPAYEFLSLLRMEWEKIKPMIPQSLAGISMQDAQNVMCEVSKYVRVRDGGSRPRNRYPARWLCT